MDPKILCEAYRLMCVAGEMAGTYEKNRQVCTYVHSTSRGHEAIQLALAFHLQPQDFVSPYYRDESLLLGLGFTPLQQMLQLLAKAGDPFTGGREYYSHPNFRGEGKPTIIHQSSATGMQAIPTTGIAQGLQYLEKIGKGRPGAPVVVCSLGDASVTEGEVSEAFQFAVLKQLPIIYLVQDNQWGISAHAQEARAMDAFEYAGGFPGMHRVRVNGSNFEESYALLDRVIAHTRAHRGPWLVQASVPLLGHHTSGVRRETYRDAEDWAEHTALDPRPLLRKRLIMMGHSEEEVSALERSAAEGVAEAFREACAAPAPDPATVESHVFAPTPVLSETGIREPAGAEKVLMVDAALHALEEILAQYPEALIYGQDVGRRLGGVFRETATLAEKFGDHRVFNTAIQEAYIIGSTAGMSAVGLKPIVEVQFADYIYPGINQLVTELSKSCYLSCGKFPINAVIRVPVGAYGGGGPYHSACVETTLLSIKGIKVVYPCNTADLKGLLKAAVLDPNPVVVLEHKGLYWSKVPGTDAAKTVEPSADYVLPFGKGRLVLRADPAADTCCVITYGMGVHWATAAARALPGRVTVVDLRSLFPLDEELIFDQVRLHGKCLIITEEQENNSFAQALAGRISQTCFRWLDGPVEVLGALNLPAVPLNTGLEAAMLPSAEKVRIRLQALLES